MKIMLVFDLSREWREKQFAKTGVIEKETGHAELDFDALSPDMRAKYVEFFGVPPHDLKKLDLTTRSGFQMPMPNDLHAVNVLYRYFEHREGHGIDTHVSVIWKRMCSWLGA